MQSPEVFARRLKLLRKHYHVSQTQVAEATCLSRGTVTNIETGRKEGIELAEVIGLAQFFKIDWPSLVDDRYPLVIELEEAHGKEE